MNWLNNCQFGNSIIELNLGNIKIKNIHENLFNIYDYEEKKWTIAEFIEIFKNFTGIKIINLSNLKLQDISFLKWNNFSHLEKINLSFNQIIDASPISSLKKLKNLNLKHNCILDIMFLKEVLEIEELNLEKNSIKDFSVVLKLEKLEIINIKNQRSGLEKEINSEENKYFYDVIEEIKKKVTKCLI